MIRRRSGIAADLVQAAARFERWRRGASATGRIPDSLWNLAVDLAREHGLSRNATTLKLGYYDLKKRVAERTALGTKGTKTSIPERARGVKGPPGLFFDGESPIKPTRLVKINVTSPEDRATVGTDPSAARGAKTEGWATPVLDWAGRPPSFACRTFGFGTRR